MTRVPPPSPLPPLPVTTANEIAGREIIECLGIVRGLTVRATGFASGLTGAIKSIAGGQIREWEEVCDRARSDAYVRMVDHARRLGADGIIAMRYDTNEFSQSATEVLAYGTAVRLAPRTTS